MHDSVSMQRNLYKKVMNKAIENLSCWRVHCDVVKASVLFRQFA